jgi:hypothetical protein
MSRPEAFFKKGLKKLKFEKDATWEQFEKWVPPAR